MKTPDLFLAVFGKPKEKWSVLWPKLTGLGEDIGRSEWSPRASELKKIRAKLNKMDLLLSKLEEKARNKWVMKGNEVRQFKSLEASQKLANKLNKKKWS